VWIVAAEFLFEMRQPGWDRHRYAGFLVGPLMFMAGAALMIKDAAHAPAQAAPSGPTRGGEATDRDGMSLLDREALALRASHFEQTSDIIEFDTRDSEKRVHWKGRLMTDGALFVACTDKGQVCVVPRGKVRIAVSEDDASGRQAAGETAPALYEIVMGEDGPLDIHIPPGSLERLQAWISSTHRLSAAR
jgi:hypothetical protein